jgi:tripartite-type tricarboxylate transporter receptor subunit TctC
MNMPFGAIRRRSLLKAGIVGLLPTATLAAAHSLVIFVPELPGALSGNTAARLRSALEAFYPGSDIRITFFQGDDPVAALDTFEAIPQAQRALFMASSSNLTTLVRLGAQDRLKALQPIGRLLSDPAMMVAPTRSPIISFTDFLARLTSVGPPQRVAISQLGSFEHLVLKRIVDLAGSSMERVEAIPSGNSGALIAAAIAGTVDVALGGASALGDAVLEGNLRGLGISRSADLVSPAIPAMADGLKQFFEENAWICVLAQSNAPADQIDQQRSDIETIVTGSQWRSTVLSLGAVPDHLHAALMPALLKLSIDSARNDLQALGML